MNKDNRPYKSKSPLETLNLARSILFDLNLTAYEEIWCKPYDSVYSCHIRLEKNGGRFGVNGKGVTRKYCLASAYGELFERIQNGFLMDNFSLENLQAIKEKNGFYFYPDEEQKDINYILSLPKDIKEDLCGIAGLSPEKFFRLYFDELKEYNNGITCIPFYNTKDYKTEYLPLNLLINRTGSNGMSAGNSLEESIYQGLAEVMERWGASEVFYNRLTPPDIPLTILKKYPDQYKIFQKIIKTTGFIVKVKDFSANLGIPVLGLLVIDERNDKYRLNVGSDISFSTALNRIITEIYQGIADNECFKKVMLPIPKKDYVLTDIEYQKFRLNSKGIFPPELFLKEKSYSFDLSAFDQKNNFTEDIINMINIFNKHENTVYIRNNSFTPFYASHVYISKVSSLRRTIQSDVNQNLSYDLYSSNIGIKYLLKLKDCNADELIYLCDFLDEYEKDKPIRKILKLDFEENSDYYIMTREFIQIMIAFKLGQFDRALDYLNILLENENYNAVEFYIVLSDLIKEIIKTDNNSLDKAYQKIDNHSKTPEIQELYQEFRKGNVFYGINSPKCPQCSKCELLNDCLTAHKLRLTDKLFKLYKLNSSSRKNISKIFNNGMI